ncbi:MAG: hypothetical protein II994_00350 [Lachnospiraceae bacterium]|nr:hypothetical protein [Lachnospiraceae bacterium]
MKAFVSKIYPFFVSAASVLMSVFSGILLCSSLLGTCYSLDMTSQEVLTCWDNPLITLIGLLLFVAFFGTIQKWVLKKPSKRLPCLFAIVLCWCICVGTLLILFSKTVPAADAWSVYSIAESLAQNDTSVVHHTDSYLSYYPQQVGLVTFFELLIRIWYLLPLDLPAYHFIKCVYVLLTTVIICFQYRTITLPFDTGHIDCGNLPFLKEKISCAYLLLIGLNLPFIMYTSFVYGEIPSFAMISIGFYYYFRFLTSFNVPTDSGASQTANKTVSSGVISLICFILSVFLRKNSLIVIIAIVLVTLIEWLKIKKHRLLLFVLFCVLGSSFILPSTQKYLEHRADNYLRSGVPAMSYFAMGMQESSRANGWYNGFNFNTYQESGMDTELTNSISKAAIKERLAYFKENPSYAGNFYLEKFLSQWADGTYASRQATLATFGGRRPIFDDLYTGTYSHYYIAYCNTYQNLLYLGAFLFCLKTRRCTSLPLYAGLIAVFGGFLFHMIWEANSRYIFTYSLLLLPYASYGITRLNASISKQLVKLKQRHGN